MELFVQGCKKLILLWIIKNVIVNFVKRCCNDFSHYYLVLYIGHGKYCRDFKRV